MSELPTPAELKRVAELLRTLLHLANRPDGTLSEIQSFAAKLEALAAAPPPPQEPPDRFNDPWPFIEAIAKGRELTVQDKVDAAAMWKRRKVAALTAPPPQPNDNGPTVIARHSDGTGYVPQQVARADLRTELAKAETLDARARNPFCGPVKILELELYQRLLDALAAPPPSANADRLRDVLRDLTDAIGKDGHARLNYWPQMQAAWAALDSKHTGDSLPASDERPAGPRE